MSKKFTNDHLGYTMNDSGSPMPTAARTEARNEESHDVTSDQGRSLSEKASHGVDSDAILEQLGNRGRYQMIQLTLHLIGSFANTVVIFTIVFVGYEPDHQCRHIDNATELEPYLADDVTNFTLHDITYKQCTIDVTVNSSGTSSTHSLPCVAGVNFSMPSDTSFLTEWSLVCDRMGLTELTQTGFFAGQALGSLVFCNLTDRYGRRKVYTFCALATMVSFVSMSFVHVYELVLVCRTACGFFEAGSENSAYTLFVELFPQERRCMASVLDSVLWSAGNIFLALMAYCLQGLSWRYLSLVCASVFVYSLLLPCFLDESLRWLIAVGKMDEAEKIVRKACRLNGKDFENFIPLLSNQPTPTNNSMDIQTTTFPLINSQEEEGNILVACRETSEIIDNGDKKKNDEGEEMLDVFDKQIDKGLGDDGGGGGGGDGEGGFKERLQTQTKPPAVKYTVLDLFRYRVVLVPFLVCVFIWMTNNLFFYVVMLGSASLSGNRFLNFGGLSVLHIPSILLTLLLMPRFNRRTLGFIFGLCAGCCLLLSVSLTALGGGHEVALTMATVAQYVGMFSLNGSFILLFVYYMEVYPTSLRSIGTGTNACVIQVTDMAAPFLLVWARETPWAPGVLVGCLCCLASLSIWLLPETRHRKLPDTIEEIQGWKKNKMTSSA